MNAIVLAAGLSQRFGSKNKLLQPYNTQHSILGETITQLSMVEDMNMVVVLGYEAIQVKQIIHHYGIPTVYNPDYSSGMVSSTKVGLSFFDNEDSYMICMGDMPHIKAANYQLFKQTFEYQQSTTIMRPTNGSSLGNPVAFSRELKANFLLFQKKINFLPLMDRVREFFVPYRTIEACFFQDIDTKKEYRSQV